MNKLMALFAFATLAVFLGILGQKVPSPDLLAVIGIVVALAAFDFVTSARDPKD